MIGANRSGCTHIGGRAGELGQCRAPGTSVADGGWHVLTLKPGRVDGQAPR